MTACGRRGKPKAGFPRASTVLGNRKSRDSHIPTAAARHGKGENQKQVSHFPTCCFFLPQNESERRPGGGSLRSRLQAHSWIRKCSAPGVLANDAGPRPLTAALESGVQRGHLEFHADVSFLSTLADLDV